MTAVEDNTHNVPVTLGGPSRIIDGLTGEIIEDTIELARRQIGTAITELHAEALIADTPQDVGRALAAFRDLKQDAATLYSEVEQHYLDCLAEYSDKVEVPGLGLVETHRRTKRTKWDHTTLPSDVVKAAAKARGYESIEDFSPVDLISELQAAISFGAGKVTRLRQLGLQPDEYCQETPDGWSVQLPPRDHGQDVA